VIDDVSRRLSIGFKADGDEIFLLGETRDELGGTEWAHVIHGHLGGRPPAVDLAAEQALARLLVQAAAQGVVSSAHDISDGGLAQAIVESCLRTGRGVSIALAGDPFVALFSESSARAVVSVSSADVEGFVELAAQHGVPLTRLGAVGGSDLEITGLFTVPLAELRAGSTGVFPALFG
jgi:phosphoribosylformylglycinamidine synthase